MSCALRRADIHHMDVYGVSPCDLAEDEEMMRALGMFKSIVMLENTAAFVIKVRPFVSFFLNSSGGGYRGRLIALQCDSHFLSTKSAHYISSL